MQYLQIGVKPILQGLIWPCVAGYAKETGMGQPLLRLKALRAARHQTLEAVAEGVGCTAGTVSRHENGGTWPGMNYIRAYAKHFGCHPAEIFFDARVVPEDAVVCPKHLEKLCLEAEDLTERQIATLLDVVDSMKGPRAA